MRLQHWLHRLGRVSLAAPFVGLGAITAYRPGYRVQVAGEFIGHDDPDLLVRATGVAMVAGGIGLAGGILPRTAAAGLAVSLVPTTLAGHAFWGETNPGERQTKRLNFWKNIVLIGALVAYAAHPGAT